MLITQWGSISKLNSFQHGNLAIFLFSILLNAPSWNLGQLPAEKNPISYYTQLIPTDLSGWLEQLWEKAFKGFLEGAAAGFISSLHATCQRIGDLLKEEEQDRELSHSCQYNWEQKKERKTWKTSQTVEQEDGKVIVIVCMVSEGEKDSKNWEKSTSQRRGTTVTNSSSTSSSGSVLRKGKQRTTITEGYVNNISENTKDSFR